MKKILIIFLLILKAFSSDYLELSKINYLDGLYDKISKIKGTNDYFIVYQSIQYNPFILIINKNLNIIKRLQMKQPIYQCIGKKENIYIAYKKNKYIGIKKMNYKTNKEIWNRIYAKGKLNSMLIGDNDKLLVSIYTSHNSNNLHQILLLEIDLKNGKVLWSKTFKDKDSVIIGGVVNGYIYLFTQENTFVDIVKLNKNGQIISKKTIFNSAVFSLDAVKKDKKNNFYLIDSYGRILKISRKVDALWNKLIDVNRQIFTTITKKFIIISVKRNSFESWPYVTKPYIELIDKDTGKTLQKYKFTIDISNLYEIVSTDDGFIVLGVNTKKDDETYLLLKFNFKYSAKDLLKENKGIVITDINGRKYHVILKKDGLYIKEFSNKVLVLNLTFYPDCPPCKYLLKILNKFYEKNKNNIVLLDINVVNRDIVKLRNFVKEHNINHPFIPFNRETKKLIDFVRDLTSTNGGTPFIYVFDKKGKLVNYHLGVGYKGKAFTVDSLQKFIIQGERR